MSTSPRLGLSYVLPSQAQKHVSVNDSFRKLDALVQLVVISAETAAEPPTPAEGDAYIIPASASGPAWGAMGVGDIVVYQDGQWIAHSPRRGWRAYVESLGAPRVYDGVAWVAEGDAGGDASFARLGVNTNADATNRIAVKSDAVLFSHDDVTPGAGDARLVINKSIAARTASAVFQNNFSGRAEIGLTGSDDFSVKVSADGAAWVDAFTVKPSGRIGMGTTAPATPFELHVDGGASASSLISSDDFVISKESGPAAFAGIVAATGASARMVFKGTRSRGTLASPAIVAEGDYTFSLLGAGYDGSTTRATAGIEMRVDGAPAAGVMPQRIEFATGTAASRVERMRITSGGDVGIGITAPTAKLDVDGPVKMKSYLKTALPSASATGAGALIYVANETGGAVIAFSDGSNWRRVTDRTIVS